MAIINIKLIPSDKENVHGVGLPNAVFLETDIPSVIYYEIGGAIPTHASPIYTSEIAVVLNPNEDAFIIKAFATNGYDTSILYEFDLNRTAVYDYPTGQTSQPANNSFLNYFPYGNPNTTANVKYLGEMSGTVYDATNPNHFYNGCDADGNPSDPTNVLFDRDNFDIIFSMADSTAAYSEQGISKGPSLVDLSDSNITFEIRKTPAPSTSNDYMPGFDPRAKVIFQNFENADDTSFISYNCDTSTYANVFEERRASQVFGHGSENSSPTMHFIRYEYMRQTNSLVFYYYDNFYQRWIISSVPLESQWESPPCMSSLAPVAMGKSGLHAQPTYNQIVFKNRKIGG